MPKLTVYNMAGEATGEIELSDLVFGTEPRPDVVHAVVRNYLNNQRQGTQSTLTRAEVRGGGRKPWRQKGTGHARQGSIRSPQWRHGGVALGPKPRDYSYTLNKKVKRLALKSALSSKVSEGNLIVVDSIALEDYRTKSVIEMLKALGADKKTLIVTPEADKVLVKSSSNIPGVGTSIVGAINTYDIVNCNKIILTTEAVQKIEEVYA